MKHKIVLLVGNQSTTEAEAVSEFCPDILIIGNGIKNISIEDIVLYLDEQTLVANGYLFIISGHGGMDEIDVFVEDEYKSTSRIIDYFQKIGVRNFIIQTCFAGSVMDAFKSKDIVLQDGVMVIASSGYKYRLLSNLSIEEIKVISGFVKEERSMMDIFKGLCAQFPNSHLYALQEGEDLSIKKASSFILFDRKNVSKKHQLIDEQMFLDIKSTANLQVYRDRSLYLIGLDICYSKKLDTVLLCGNEDLEIRLKNLKKAVDVGHFLIAEKIVAKYGIDGIEVDDFLESLCDSCDLFLHNLVKLNCVNLLNILFVDIANSGDIDSDNLSDFLDQKDSNGETPLLIAVRNNNLQIVDLLLKHNANANVVGFDGLTPLEIASNIGSVSICELLKSYSPKTKVLEGQLYDFQDSLTDSKQL